MEESLNRDDVIGLANASGAYRRVHVRLKNGNHSDAYVNCAQMLCLPGIAGLIGYTLAGRVNDRGCLPQIVVGPTSVQALVIGVMDGFVHQGSDNRLIGAAWLDKKPKKKEEEGFLFPRRLDEQLRGGADVLLVDDMLTAGTTTRQMIEAVAVAGGTVVGALFIFDRSRGLTAEDLGVPWIDAIATLDEAEWALQNCPLCKQGVPLDTSLGHGAKTS